MTILYILLALVVFGLLVMIHELGHFLVARLFGVGIREFSIGMGPKLFSWKGKKKWGEPDPEKEEPLVPPVSFDPGDPVSEPEDYRTTYSLRLLPIGGYVSMVGEDEENEHPAAFGQKNVWKRIAVVVAGAFMNILLGFLLMLVLVVSTRDDSGVILASNVVAEFREEATSNQWLEVGDVITHVNGTRVHTGNEVIYEIMYRGYDTLNLTVEREGQVLELRGVTFPQFEEEGITFGLYDFAVAREQASFGAVIKHTFFRSCSTVKMIFDQLADLLTGRFGLNAVSGPIGITEEMGNAAKDGFGTFLYLVIVITINLGVFNLLPIPALDGGRLLFLLIEAITRRPVDPKIEGYIHFAGLMILLGIMLLVACKDIAGLFI